MKLMIGIPVLDNVSWPFFLYTSALIGKLARKYELELCFVNRCAIDRAREITVTDAIQRKCDRLLFIDDDTIIPANTVELLNPLLENEKAIVASGFCYQRGYKYMPMVYRYEGLEWGKGQPQLIEPFPKEPFQVSCTGMGVSLLKVSLLEVIQKKNPPCFGRAGYGTEDFYFFEKVSKEGLTAWVNPDVEATHLGLPQCICSRTADKLRTEDHCAIYFQEKEDGGRATKGVVHL